MQWATVVCRQRDSAQHGPPPQPLLNTHLPRGDTHQGRGEGKAAQLHRPEPLSCYLETPTLQQQVARGPTSTCGLGMGVWEPWKAPVVLAKRTKQEKPSKEKGIA